MPKLMSVDWQVPAWFLAGEFNYDVKESWEEREKFFGKDVVENLFTGTSLRVRAQGTARNAALAALSKAVKDFAEHNAKVAAESNPAARKQIVDAALRASNLTPEAVVSQINAEVAKFMATWKPGIKVIGVKKAVDPMSFFSSNVQNMTIEQLTALAEQIAAAKKARK